jgi:hypothetical protein
MSRRIWPFVALVPAYIIGKLVDEIGGFWNNSFIFIALITFFTLFRLYMQFYYKSWRVKDEWIFVPLYLLLIPSLWWWVKSASIIFILTYAILLSSWLIYVRSLVSNNAPNRETD